jgi:hypothetical protein
MITQAVEADLKALDELLALVEPASELAMLAVEHLHGARIYLLGAMDAEYALNLEMAREALARVPENAAIVQARRILNSVLERHRHARRRPRAA